MTRLRSRLDTLIRHRKAAAGLEVWRQATDGADAYTSPQHPGERLTRAELTDRAPAPGARRVVVYRVGTDPPPADVALPDNGRDS